MAYLVKQMLEIALRYWYTNITFGGHSADIVKAHYIIEIVHKLEFMDRPVTLPINYHFIITVTTTLPAQAVTYIATISSFNKVGKTRNCLCLTV